MALNAALADRVRRLLARRRNVSEKRMVGGLGFSVNGALCCGVTGDDLMVRVQREERDRLLKMAHVRPMVFTGRRLAAFVRIDPIGVKTDATLRAWIDAAIEAVAAESAEGGRSRTAATRRRPPSSTQSRTTGRTDDRDARFDDVVRAFAGDDRVSRGGKGFGSSGLKVNGKLFAMISDRRGEFVVKLPKARAEALVKSGDARFFDPGHGRKMTQWITVGGDANWIELAREGRAYVGAEPRTKVR
jgi:TfoX/Sxy family transcriptional regulator of competence genes